MPQSWMCAHLSVMRSSPAKRVHAQAIARSRDPERLAEDIVNLQQELHMARDEQARHLLLHYCKHVHASAADAGKSLAMAQAKV